MVFGVDLRLDLRPFRGLLSRALLLSILTLAVAKSGHAQVSRVNTGFQSDASRYLWTAGIDVDQRSRDWLVTFRNQFRSEAFLLSQQVNEFRDENYTNARIGRAVNSNVWLMGFGEGSWFSQNSSSTVEGYGGLRYAPHPIWFVEAGAGAVVDRKPGLILEGQTEPDILTDAGPGVSVSGELANLDISGFRIGAQSRNRWHFISPRFGRSLSTTAEGFRDFDRGQLRVGLRFGDLVRESYQASSFLNRLENAQRADDTIEATQSDTIEALVDLEYALSSNWTFVASGMFETDSRYIRTLRAPEEELFFDTNFNRQRTDLQATAAYSSRSTTFRFTASRAVTVERRRLDNADDLPPGQAAQKILVLRQADFDRGVFWVQAIGQHWLSRWLAFRGSYRASILRHDTPDANRDDRDESLFDGDLGLIVRFHRTLEAEAKLYGVQHHTVYLDGTRSGENHRRRSLRLVPSMRWRPGPKTDLRLQSEVRATYTVDDFTFPDQPKNDQSARELKYAASLNQQVATGTRLLLDAGYSQLMLGRLLWEDFDELPFDTVSTTSGWARLELDGRWRTEIGVRAFYRTEYERSVSVRYTPPDTEGTTKVVSRPGRKRLLQIGPTAAFSFRMSNNSEIRMAGWVQFQQTRLELYGDLPEDDEAAIIEAGRTAERRTIPNLSITVLWNL